MRLRAGSEGVEADASGVGEGDGEGVGDVGGRGGFGESELGLDRLLHLLFGGVAIPGDGFFDLGGGQVDDGESAALGTQEDDAAGVGHEDSGSGMSVVGVEFFDGDDVGGALFKQIVEVLLELGESLFEAEPGVEPDDAGFDEARVGEG